MRFKERFNPVEERAKMRGWKVTAKRGGLSGEIEVTGVQGEGDSESRKRVRQGGRV